MAFVRLCSDQLEVLCDVPLLGQPKVGPGKTMENHWLLSFSSLVQSNAFQLESRDWDCGS